MIGNKKPSHPNSAAIIAWFQLDFNLVRLLIAVVLLLAAGAKTWQLADSAVPEWQVAASNLALLSIPCELVLAGWLVVGGGQATRRRLWSITFLLFLGFVGASLHQVLRKADSCGCFGKVELSPHWALLLDIAILGLLWFSRQSIFGGGTVGPNRANGSLLPAGVTGSALLFVWQVTLFSWSDLQAQSAGDRILLVRTIPSRSGFLKSEVDSLPAEDRVRAVQFLVTNTSGQPLRLAIESPNCGCLGFSVDGRPVQVESTWSVVPGHSIRLGAIVPLRSAVSSYENAFDVVAAAETDGDVVFRRRLAVQTTIERDVICYSPALRFEPVNRSDEARRKILLIERLIRNGQGLDVPSVVVEDDSPSQSGVTVESCQLLGQLERYKDGLMKATFRVQLRVDPPRFDSDVHREVTHSLVRICFVGGLEKDLRIEETVPVAVVHSATQTGDER